jgi:hypothetical protein
MKEAEDLLRDLAPQVLGTTVRRLVVLIAALILICR